MIVDSPGVGESDVMSEFVLNYLPRAFCFMYVIGSNNAGGIHDDRVSVRKVEYFIRIRQLNFIRYNKNANANKESRNDGGLRAHAG